MHARCVNTPVVRARKPSHAPLRSTARQRAGFRRRQELRKWRKAGHAAFCAALTLPALSHAQSAAPAQLAPIHVQGTGFKADRPQSPKYRKPISETPQSITVVPEEVLRQQGAQKLDDILANVPGITFSSGEGGLGWGDMFTIRGFTAEQGITIDGVRDTALDTRSDIFNLEQVEVFKGTGSVETGVGMPGGAVNLVTKTPKLNTLREVTGAIGSSDYRRATLDINQPLGEHAALRLNAMRHHNRSAGRGPAEFSRWGIAPSLALGLGTSTTLTLAHIDQHDTNVPDFGLPISRATGMPMRGVSRHYWAGLKGVDTEQTRKSATTMRVTHQMTPALAISNQTRWAKARRLTLLSTGGRALNAWGAKGLGIQDIKTGYSDYFGYDRAGNETYPTGFLATQRLNNYLSAYSSSIFANQTDITFDIEAGGLRHAGVVGVEYYEDSYRRRTDNRLTPPYGQRWVYDVRNPAVTYAGPYVPAGLNNRSGAEISNWGIYAHDHITLNRHWEVAGGLRFDDFTAYWYDRAGKRLPFRQSAGLWSGRFAIIHKPVENASIYLSYSTATQPSAADAATKRGEGANADVSHYSPGKARSWELGGKWDVLDRRLALTAALFQVERSNPTDMRPGHPGERIQLAARHRVRGLELGAAGSITPDWSIMAGLALMDGGRIMEDAEHPRQVGGKLQNVPRATVNLWTSYRFAPEWVASLGGQYVSERRYASGTEVRLGRYKGHHVDTSAPAYWVANAALEYRPGKMATVRLNVNNIFDKFYIQRVSASYDRFQLYGVPGAGRTVTLTTELQF